MRQRSPSPLPRLSPAPTAAFVAFVASVQRGAPATSNKERGLLAVREMHTLTQRLLLLRPAPHERDASGMPPPPKKQRQRRWPTRKTRRPAAAPAPAAPAPAAHPGAVSTPPRRESPPPPPAVEGADKVGGLGGVDCAESPPPAPVTPAVHAPPPVVTDDVIALWLRP
jgi:hypothetical protein